MDVIETKELGKCYRRIDDFALYKDKAGFASVYNTYKENGKEYAYWRGYLAYPEENFAAVVEELKYEDKLALAEFEAELRSAQ